MAQRSRDDKDDILKSEFEIHEQRYTVRLTSRELHWEQINAGGTAEQQANACDGKIQIHYQHY